MSPTEKTLLDGLEAQAAQFPAIRRFWEVLLPDLPVPNDSQMYTWTRSHSRETIVGAIQLTASKSARMLRYQKRAMDSDHSVRYASKCMNNTITFNHAVPVNPEAPGVDRA